MSIQLIMLLLQGFVAAGIGSWWIRVAYLTWRKPHVAALPSGPEEDQRWKDGYVAGAGYCHATLANLLEDCRRHQPLNLHDVEVYIRKRQSLMLEAMRNKQD